jgi:hypothetical protein
MTYFTIVEEQQEIELISKQWIWLNFLPLQLDWM